MQIEKHLLSTHIGLDLCFGQIMLLAETKIKATISIRKTMLDLFERIYKIAKASTLHTLEEILERRRTEESFTYSEHDHYTDHEDWSSFDSGDQSSFRSTEETNYYSEVPQQVVEDLSVFGLRPPSSFEEVRNARNREIKKFHPDRFMNDPEKLETSKEIMQMINAAHDRLKEYYKNK